MEDLPLFCCREEENKGSGGESMEKKTYLLYIVEKKRTKATPWLLQIVEGRVQRRSLTSCT